MEVRFFAFLLMLFVSANSNAQFQNVLIGQFANETTIEIDPLNTNRMMAGANLNDYYYSSDGGLTWHGGNLNSSWGNAGDPNVVTDSLGNFYYFHLVPSIDQIVCQTSTVFPPSWNGGSAMGQQPPPKLQDHDWPYSDWTNHRIYCTWTQYDNYPPVSPADSTHILLCASYDFGQTWTSVKRLDEHGGDCDFLDVVEPRPYVSRDGKVYVTWEDQNGIWMDCSSDSGTTWLAHDLFVATVPGGVYYSVPGLSRIRCTPYIGIDRSNSIHQGTIYESWCDQRNGMNNSDIWLSSSTDSGQTWTAPVRVNDDLTLTHQFMNAMAIDQVNGNIYVVYYDRRNYVDDSTDVYLACSMDGGLTFINSKISAEGFIPVNDFLGDYISIAAFNNVIRPVWTSVNSSGNSEIYTAIVDGSIFTGISSAPLVLEKDLSVQPNRVNQSAMIRFSMKESGKAEVVISDLPGKMQQHIYSGVLPAGDQSIDLNAAGLSPGMYICRLITAKKEQAAKFIVIR